MNPGRAEGYNGILNRMFPPTFRSTVEYTTKTKTNRNQKIRQHCFPHSSFPPIPVGSDCESLYPTLGHNQVNHNTTLDNAYEFNRIKSQSQMALGKLTHEVKLKKMADARYNNYQKNDASSASSAYNHQTSSNTLEQENKKLKAPLRRDPMYANDDKFFIKETSAEYLERKFHRFTEITKPRQTLNYFIGEFERLNVTDDHTKYNIIVENWVPDEVGQYYTIVSPEKQNFQSFKDFLKNVIIP